MCLKIPKHLSIFFSETYTYNPLDSRVENIYVLFVEYFSSFNEIFIQDHNDCRNIRANQAKLIDAVQEIYGKKSPKLNQLIQSV